MTGRVGHCDQPQRVLPFRCIRERFGKDVGSLLLSVSVNQLKMSTFELLPEPGERHPLGPVSVPHARGIAL